MNTREAGQAPGFVAIARGLWDDPEFRDAEMSPREAWIWMIARATWKQRAARVGSKVVTLERGQLAYSTRYLAKIFKWSEARVRRYLKVIEGRSKIDAATDAGITVITIRNYDKYQTPPDKGDALSDAEATQQRRTSDASKNKDNQDNKLPPFIPPGDKWKDDFNPFWKDFPKSRSVNVSKARAGPAFALMASRHGGPACAAAAKIYAAELKRENQFPVSVLKFLDPSTGLLERYLPQTADVVALHPMVLDLSKEEHRFLQECLDAGWTEGQVRGWSTGGFRIEHLGELTICVVDSCEQKFRTTFKRLIDARGLVVWSPQLFQSRARKAAAQ
jgi:hypothetical protein